MPEREPDRAGLLAGCGVRGGASVDAVMSAAEESVAPHEGQNLLAESLSLPHEGHRIEEELAMTGKKAIITTLPLNSPAAAKIRRPKRRPTVHG